VTDLHQPTDDPGTGEGVDAELESGLVLTPRTAPSSPSRVASKRRQRRIFVGSLLVVLLGGAAFLVSQLTEATTYFYNADQAVAKKASLGSRTFRIQGTVMAKPVKTSSADGERLRFHIAFNGVDVPCDYSGGEPSALFKAGEPVVLVGHFSGATFAANQILVKHDSVYKEKHPDRLGPEGQ
jgi:cytochrome c-type biogenesis protein CcmE